VVDARGQKPFISSLYAEVTLLHDIFLGDKLGCAKGAGLDAQLAPCTFLLVNEDDAVGALMDSIFRARFNARRLATVFAGHGHIIHREFAPSLFGTHFMNFNEVRAYGEAVLLLAGYLAGQTAIAKIDIHKKRFLFHGMYPSARDSACREDP
jgi:hypothetical protein